jgi:uncharacterized protein HemY
MRKAAFLILVALFFLTSIAQAAPPEALHSLTAMLDRWDVEEAGSEIKDILAREPKDPELLELASRISFHRGEYQEALKLMKQALETGGEEEKRKQIIRKD